MNKDDLTAQISAKSDQMAAYARDLGAKVDLSVAEVGVLLDLAQVGFVACAFEIAREAGAPPYPGLTLADVVAQTLARVDQCDPDPRAARRSWITGVHGVITGVHARASSPGAKP